MIRLGVNVDHVATVRQARRGHEPDPVTAAHEAELGGADVITVHLREDRRHVTDRDVRLLAQTLQVPMNLELAVAADVLALALEVRPRLATLVPERREEVTTEGGLDVAGQLEPVRAAVARLAEAGVAASLFVDPDPRQLEAVARAGAAQVELHTGPFAHAWRAGAPDPELTRLRRAADTALELGLRLAIGHGLDYRNVVAVRDLPGLEEMHIGHAIVSRALYVGLREAVRQMKALLGPR